MPPASCPPPGDSTALTTQQCWRLCPGTSCAHFAGYGRRGPAGAAIHTRCSRILPRPPPVWCPRPPPWCSSRGLPPGRRDRPALPRRAACRHHEGRKETHVGPSTAPKGGARVSRVPSWHLSVLSSSLTALLWPPASAWFPCVLSPGGSSRGLLPWKLPCRCLLRPLLPRSRPSCLPDRGAPCVSDSVVLATHPGTCVQIVPGGILSARSRARYVGGVIRGRAVPLLPHTSINPDPAGPHCSHPVTNLQLRWFK